MTREEIRLDEPIESHDEIFKDLYSALGRMVFSGGHMEMNLRSITNWLAGDDDAAWIVFEGQSVDSLVQNGHAMLKEHDKLGTWTAETSEGIAKVLRDVKDTYALRNQMVHGMWLRSCLGADDCEPRPKNNAPDDRVFHVCRSRNKKGVSEQQIAVRDIEDLTQRMFDLIRDLHSARRAAQLASGDRRDA